MKIGRNIDLIPRYIAGLYPHMQSFNEADTSLFIDYTKLTANLVSRSFPGFALCDQPGYLLRHDGTHSYRIPYNLVPTFPTSSQVQWLEPIISSARLTTSSKFCFSGSSTFLGQLVAIGDLDFCEYISGTKDIPSEVEAKRANNHLQLVKVKCGVTNAVHPFTDSIFNEAELNAEEAQPFKLDFIFRDEKYVALAVTNVIILTNGEMVDAALNRSFAFQEVIIGECPPAIPSRSLDDAREFGRYANWLKDEVDCYVTIADQNEDSRHLALKALKRALSWFLIVGLEQEVDAIITKLKTERLEELASVYRAAEVAKLTSANLLLDEKDAVIGSADHRNLLGDLLKLAKSLQQTMNEYLIVQSLEKTG